MKEIFLPTQSANLGLTSVAVGFVLCFLFSIILTYIYTRHRSLTPLEVDPQLFIFVSLVTFLIVVVIQDSLMLSLGMVGALSIVRFRSPVKNTLDLGYIFFAVAIGVGFASGKLLVTVLITSSILSLLYARVIQASSKSKSPYDNGVVYEKVWIIQIENIGADLSEVLDLMKDTSPDGFSYQDSVVEIRILGSFEKVQILENNIKEMKVFKIKSIDAI